MTAGLHTAQFTKVASGGFGDPQNSYAHAMCTFRDAVYVGTSRHALPLLKLFPPRDPPAMQPWPVPVPESVEDLDLRGEIWRRGPRGGWKRVHRSPEIEGRTGGRVPRDLGYRGMVVFQGRSDGEPAMYVTSVSSVARGTGARLLRSEDGRRFEAVSSPGLGNPRICSLRTLVEFDGFLYTAPAGEGTTWNTVSKPILLRSQDPAEEDWEQACEPGFGNPTNAGIFELQVFDDHLYAGTFNAIEGYQVWKAAASGGGPLRWTKVLERGAGRGPFNEMAMSLCPFEGALYVGSGIQNGGYDRQNLVGPAAAELVRVWPDDTWELVVGSPRENGDGDRRPLSGAGPGFDNLFAGYIWRMAVHDGSLYATTFDWSVFLPYAQRPPRSVRRMMRGLGTDRIVDQGGGFALLRSPDGVNWTTVTENGFGNPYNHGGRNLLSTPEGLFVGTANPFGPQVAARISTGWVYVDNPSGGAEVWLGSHVAPAEHPVSIGTASSNGAGPPPVLLTGASGFIGSHLLEELLARGTRVRVLALEETVRDIPHRDRVELVVGGLSDAEALAEAVHGARRVFHLAALLPGAAAIDLQEVNVRGTENLLRACAREGILERFVFTSSVAVYEGAFMPDEWPLAETAAAGPRGSDSLRSYGISKIEAERLVRRYAAEEGFEHVILRPSTCYGAGSERVRELINRVLLDPSAGRDAGAQFPMQLIHVRDLAVAIAEAGALVQASGETFNVAGAEGLSYREVARLIRRLAGRAAWLAAGIDGSWAWRRYLRPYDISKIADRLGFTPAVRMDEGFAEALADEGLLHDGLEGGEAYEDLGDGRARRGWLAGRRELADTWR